MDGLRSMFLTWSILAVTVPAMLPARPIITQMQHLDKTWTIAGTEKRSGSQALTELGLASRVSFLAEGMGISRAPFRKFFCANGLSTNSCFTNELSVLG
jgi:hypothetical protein